MTNEHSKVARSIHNMSDDIMNLNVLFNIFTYYVLFYNEYSYGNIFTTEKLEANYDTCLIVWIGIPSIYIHF